MKKLRPFLYCVSVLAITACSSNTTTQGMANSRLDVSQQQATAMSGMFDRVETKKGPSNLEVREGVYLGGKGKRIRTGDALPSHFEGKNGVVISASKKVNIQQFSEMLAKATGVRININDLMNTPRASGVTASSAGTDFTFQDPSILTGGSSGSEHPTSKTFYVEYSGPLSGILDRVAASIGADWRFEGGVVEFVGPQTRSYAIAINSSRVETSSSVSTTNSILSVDYWKDFTSGLNAAINDEGAKYSLNTTTGSLTVTGTDATHARVARFISSENERVSRQVALTVDIVSWTSNDTQRMGTNVDAALNGILDSTLDLSLGGPTAIDAVGPRLTANLLSGDLAGTEAILDVLNKRGRASLLNTTSVVALNNMPTPVKVAQEQSYVSNVTTTTQDDGSTSTSLVAETVDSGLDLVVTPRVLGDGDIFLTMSGKLTDILEISEFTSAGSQVQLPVTSVSEFMQSVSIENGQTMLLASTTRSKASRDQSGPFSPKAWGLGGSNDASVENTQVFVLVRPQVIDRVTRKGLFR